MRVLYDALSMEIMKRINCARPGKIISFNAANATASVQIAQQKVTSVSPTGQRTLASYPPLQDVPVFVLGGGNCVSTFPIATGDECILVFSDRELDNWLQQGGISSAPSTPRLHDFSDAFCLVGVRSFPSALGSYSTSSAQLRSVDGATRVDLNAGTQIVTIVAPGGITLDAPIVTITGVLNTENTGSVADGMTITGTIKATGDVQADNGSISLVNHVHTGVQSGGSNTGPATG